MTYLNVHVPGQPHPQGSKRIVRGNRMIEANPNTRAWRATVTAHTVAEMIHVERQAAANCFPYTGPCTLIVCFHLTRPANHYRTGKFRHLLRNVAPREVQVGPDLDKLVRAVGDALQIAGACVDDKQINLIRAAKKWTEGSPFTTIQFEGEHRAITR